MKKYGIINIEHIEGKIQEWEKDLQECYKAPVGEFNSDYVSTLQQAIATAKDIIALSIPLENELEKAFDAGRKLSNKSQLYTPDFYWTKQDYISNLKLDI